MALEDRVYEMTQRATVALRINGVNRQDWISMSGGDSDDNPVPYCDIVFPDYSGILRGMPVTLDAGYSNEHIRLFTGGVFARGDEDPDALRTQCYVRGRTDSEGNTVEALASVIDPPVVWPPIPAGQYIDFEIADSLIWEDENAAEIALFELGQQARIPRRPSGEPLKQIVHGLGDLKGAFRSYKIPARDLSGMMIKDAMAGILADSGVAAWTFDFDDYELAPDGVLIDRAPGSQGLGLLMTLRHLKMHQLRSGIVLFRQVDEQPASTAAFTYKSSDVSVARIMDNPSEVRVPFNPLLQKGMTIEIEDEATKIVTSRWYLRGHRWEIGLSGDWSYMDLVGGEDFGSAIGINPTPQFVYYVDLEYMGGELVAIVQFDAQTSFDGDGTLDGGDISWDDNQTPALISGTGFRKRVVVPVADIVDPWIVKATGTDSDGLTGIEEQTIDTSTAGSAVEIPAIGVAGGDHGQYSPDSAGHWYDNAGADNRAVCLRPSDGVHFGHALYGYEDGHLELTRDSNQTQTVVMAAVGSPIKKIAWDWRNTLVAYALTEDCRLYVCTNMDAPTPTFGLYGGAGLRTTLALPNAVGNLIGLPAGGGVYVFGGKGDGFPLIAYDAAQDNHWVTQILLGDILADGPGDPDCRIVDFTAPGYQGATMILANYDAMAPVYHTTAPPGPSAAYTRATGLSGLGNGVAILPNGPLAPVTRIAIFEGSEDCYKSTDGIAYTIEPNVLPAGFECHHAMWLSDVLTGLPAFDGIYLLALENAGNTGGVYKSVDELSSEVQPLRDDASDDAWPAGDIGWQMSIGAPGRTAVGGTDMLVAQQSTNAHTPSSYARRVASLSGGVLWELEANPAAASQAGITKLRSLNGVLFRIIANILVEGVNCNNAGQLQRSIDDGGSWSDVGPTPVGPISSTYWGITDIRAGADGTLWAVACTAGSLSGNAGFSPPTLYKSTDNGATWTSVYTDSTKDSGFWRRFIAVAPHPTNAGVVVVVGDRGLRNLTTWRSTDATAGSPTFTVNTGVSSSTADEVRAVILGSGRLVVMIQTAGIPRFSDDYGVTWTVGSGLFANRQYALLRAGVSDVLFAMGGNVGTSELYRSLDAGASWSQVFDDSAMAGGVSGFYGLAYSATTDRLYLATNAVVAAERVFAIATPATAAAPFVPDDISYNLDTLFSGTTDFIGVDCLTVGAA